MSDFTGHASPDFTEPRTAQSYEDEADYLWEKTIELRLSKHAQALVGIGAGLVVVAALNVLQGRIVINLAKGQKMIVEVLNSLSPGNSMSRSSESPAPATSTVKYAEPSQRVETPQPNEDELNELRNRMRESGGDSASPFEGF